MWCPGEGGGGGRCVTSEEVRLDRPASELWLTVAGPMPRAVRLC